MQVRDETIADAPAVGKLIAEAFAGAPISDGNEAGIVERLRSEGALTISLVAEDEGRIVGHAAFSPVAIDGNQGSWFGLGPVAVAPCSQDRGVGRALVEEGLNRLRDIGAHGCVVLGEPVYYGRFGFSHDPNLRYGRTGKHFQRLVLGGVESVGEVRYHPAFGSG
ncbi:MAG: N-acetyltransferase [Caulobacteraceae bacterium]|nr:N-acetyltransferase [Caulobacteraceae bacterium]